MLLSLVACFAELVETGLWAIKAEQHRICKIHSISGMTSQEGIKLNYLSQRGLKLDFSPLCLS